MARKVLFHRTGSAKVLQIVEVPTPEPGVGEVRLRVRALGINRSEVNFRAGTYGQPPSLPAQLGFEAAGQIDAVGPGVSGFAIGDAVSVLPGFSSTQYGMYGDMVLAPVRVLAKHPAALSWEEAAATWMQFATAWVGLIDIANLSAGDIVLITAASSSVGLAAIQVARRTGAVPVALTRHSRKGAALKRAGAEHVIATEEQDIEKEVSRLTGGKGARVIFDAVGGPSFARLIASAAMDGIVLVYGVLSKEVNALSAIHTIRRGLTIRGFAVPGVLEDDAKLAASKSYIVDGLEAGALRPQIAKRFPFDKIADAHRYLESNEQFGKVVVTV